MAEDRRKRGERTTKTVSREEEMELLLSRRSAQRNENLLSLRPNTTKCIQESTVHFRFRILERNSVDNIFEINLAESARHVACGQFDF